MWKLNLTLPIQIRWTPKRRRHSEPPPRIDDIASIPAMTGWNSLPVEIRLDIFKLVAQNDIQAGALRRAEHDDIEGPNKDKPLHLRTTQRLSHRSQVCQEWQAYFEPLIYESMTLDNSDLSRFRRVMKRRLVRLRFLRVVKLRMMLLDRDCRICSRSSHRAEDNSQLFARCIHSLLRTLSLWQPTTSSSSSEIIPPLNHNGQGLQLQLITDRYCPRSLIRPATRGPILAAHELMMTDPASIMPPWEIDPPRSFDSHLRFPSDFQDDALAHLPCVPLVFSLSVKGSDYRIISVQALASIIEHSLENLVELQIEYHETVTWTSDSGLSFDNWTKECQTYLLPVLPASLRRFCLVPANFLDEFGSDWQGLGVAIALRGALSGLVEFGGTAMSAVDFLHCLSRSPGPFSSGSYSAVTAAAATGAAAATIAEYASAHIILPHLHWIPGNRETTGPEWSNLRFLCLECSDSDSGPMFASTLLSHEAAAAARKLPQLEIMELWSIVNRFDFYLFRFRMAPTKDGHVQPRILWQTNNILDQDVLYRDEELIPAWEGVARAKNRMLRKKALATEPWRMNGGKQFGLGVGTVLIARGKECLCSGWVLRYLELERLVWDEDMRMAQSRWAHDSRR